MLPQFYIGNRGCGKTFSQNIWLDKHISEFEENKIFHVRCDVHKIYNLFKGKGVKKKELDIETYLNMQFLYIFLKYRSKEYNNKCENKEGAESNLMKCIDDELDKKYSGFTNNNNKFEDLGDFLDQQSSHIHNSEVNLRPKDRQYSYAVFLMKNVFLDGERTKEVENILNDYNNLADKLKEKKGHKELDKFLDGTESAYKESTREKILSVIDKNKSELPEIQRSDLRTFLLKTKVYIKSNKLTTTKLWIEVSKYIQNFIISKGYKLLKIMGLIYLIP